MVEWLASNKMTPFMSEVSNLVTYAIPDLNKVPNEHVPQRLENTQDLCSGYRSKNLILVLQDVSFYLFSGIHRLPGLPEGLILSALLYLKKSGYKEIPYTIAPSFFALAPSINKGLKPTRQPGLGLGCWVDRHLACKGEPMVSEERTGTCQDAGGFIIITFVFL